MRDGDVAARRRIYAHALDGGYRFLSYGDACLFLALIPDGVKSLEAV